MISKTDNQVLVSIVCITYNHEKYIRQALDGFVMQKTSFPFEIIVHDDASTDSTANIVREYEKNYPRLFNNIYRIENWYSQGKDILGYLFQDVVKGKYIALCEGDDYWTDPYKLQKQVDFLEEHEDYDLCYTDFDCYKEDEKLWEKAVYKNDVKQFYRSKDFVDHIVNKGYLAPMTWVFRRTILSFVDKKGVFTDGTFAYALDFFHNSKLYFLPEVTAVYRSHIGSASRPSDNIDIFRQWKGVFDTQIYYMNKYNCSNELCTQILYQGYISLLPLALKVKANEFIESIKNYFNNNDSNLSFLINDYIMKSNQLHDIENSRSFKLFQLFLRPIVRILSILK
jgi:glycosyltransferase involved in cell wall biosynthesis